MPASERCIGCGGLSVRHPWVAVTIRSGGPVALPVCMACQRDPLHRRFPIKGHFFKRELATQALAAAGSTTVGGH